MNIVLKEIFIFSLSMSIILIYLTGCSWSKEEKTIENKTNAEIEYLEDNIFVVVNKYVKGEYENYGIIQWDSIEKDTKKISDTLDTILVDFSEYDISNEELLNFRNNVDNLNILVANKEESNLLIVTSEIYKQLPSFLEKYSQDYNKINLLKLKSLVLESIAYSNISDWENAKNTINIAEDKYNEMMNDTNFIKEYSYDINKIYVLLEEIKNSINLEELKLTKIKYINFIEKI